MSTNLKWVLKPSVIVREETDGYSLLFDSQSGKTLVLNPTGSIICHYLERSRSLTDIVDELRIHFLILPNTVEERVTKFIKTLECMGLVVTC